MITFNVPINRSHLPLLFALLLLLSSLGSGFSADLVHQGRIFGYASPTVQHTLTYGLVVSSWGVAVGGVFWGSFVGVWGKSTQLLQILSHPTFSVVNSLLWIINLFSLRLLFSSGILECGVEGSEGLSSCREIQVTEVVGGLNVLVSLTILVASTFDRSSRGGAERGGYSKV